MRLAHFGTFDVENFGDLLYPLIARHRLSAAGADITFVSPVGGPPVWRDCVETVPSSALDDLELDGVLLGGGNIVHAGLAGVDAYRGDGLTALLAYSRLWHKPSEIANARGLPLCWNAPGVPQPLTPRASQVLRWAAKEVRYLSVRDAQSLRHLRHAGVTGTVPVVPDSALEVSELWPEAALREAREELFGDAGRTVPERTIAVHLNQRYISGPALSLAERLDRLAERFGATPLLLALGPCHGDGGVVRSVGAKMASEPLVVDRPASLRQLVAAIAGAEAYLGSSMHGMITAAAFGRPGIVVAREAEGGGKFSGFLEQFQLDRWLLSSWSETEDRVDELLESAPSEVARVLSAAKPTLDEHWARIAEVLLGGAKTRRGTGPRSRPAPSLEGITEEGIDSLLALADKQRRRTAVESARADAAVRELAEAERAAESKLAEVRDSLTTHLEKAREGEAEGERLETETRGLREQLDTLRGRLSAADAQAESAREEADAGRTARERLDVVERDHAEVEARLREQALRSEELELALSGASKREDELAAQIAELKALLSAAADSETVLEVRLAGLESELKAIVEERSELEERLAGLQSELSGSVEERSGFEERLAGLQAELRAATDGKAVLAERFSELEEALSAAAERERALEQRLGDLTAARDDADRQLHAAKSAAAERELEMQRSLTELEALRTATDRRLEGATSEIERRAADVRALTQVLAQREDTFRASIDAQTEANRVVARLEGELAAAHVRHADAQSVSGRLEAVETQLDEARSQLDEARRRVAERDAIVSRLSDAIEHAQTERDAAGERLQAADEEVAEADRGSAELEAELGRMSAELEELRAGTQERVAVNMHARAEAERAAAQAESRVAAALAERDLQASRTQELRRQLDELQKLAERAAEADREAAELRRELEGEGAQRRHVEGLHEESLVRERALRDRLVLERDSLEERLEATLAALNEARLPAPGGAATEQLEAERGRLHAELLTESAARQGLEEHVAALREEIAQRVRALDMGAEEFGVTTRVELPRHAERDSSGIAADPEAASRAEFSDRYAELCRRSGLDHFPEAERALPWPVFPPVPGGAWEPRVSIIICVHNALADVRRCLESVARHLTVDAEVVLVDDGSEAATAGVLETVARSGPRVRLIANPDPPHGYTVAANLGLRAAIGDYLILLNSDTIVTAGWLERIIACAESDPEIGIVGPVSNAASHQSVPKVREDGAWATNPLPQWLTVEGMGVAVAGASSCEYPRVPFVNGYCYAISRRTLDVVGLLDEENFAAGYCEENDFSLRARQEGFTGAIADDAFVFHAKSRSYTPEGRNEHAKRNYARFLEKHGVETIQPLVDTLESTPPVAELGRRLEHVLLDQAKLVSMVQERLGSRVRPLFVLPGIAEGGSGGSHSIVQEVAGMRRLGVPARIAISEKAIERARLVYPGDLELFTPYKSESALSEVVGDANVVVATHSDSVGLVRAVLAQRPEVLPAYYVQDYEPFFWDQESESTRRAVASYTALEGACLFAKTHWVCNVVSAAHRVPVHKVEPSIDSSIYRPPDATPDASAPVVIVAMVRPRTPRRQPRATVRLLERLARSFGEGVEIATFGCPPAAFDQLTEMPLLRECHRGMLSRPAVADLLRRADVFVDHSVYQAFGRTALEAMACACVPVVPAAGGAWEFAEPDVNSMVCDTSDEAAVYAAVARVVEDRALRDQLKAAGLGTAAGYSVERAAMSEFALFASALLLRNQTGSVKGLAARVG